MLVTTRIPHRPTKAQFNLLKFLLACVALGALGGTAYSYAKDIFNTYYLVPLIEKRGAVVYSDFVRRYGFSPPDRNRSWGGLIEWGLSTPDEIYVGLKPLRRSDSLIAELSNIPNVRCIILAAADISNKDLESLAQSRGIEEVRLTGTSISDGGMVHLAKLRHMKRLDLSYTSISDAGMSYVKDMRALEELRVDNTNVSEAGLDYVRRHCPQIRIHATKTRVNSRAVPLVRLHMDVLQDCQIGS